MSKGYNGWTNYETWCVNLWIDNEQNEQEYWAKEAEECLRNFEGPDDATCRLADYMQDAFLEAKYSLCKTHGVFEDLLNAALSEVNWHEIAKHYVDEAKEALNA